jgi:serine protease Do
MAAGSKIDVFLSTVEQGTSYPAKLIGFDSETDLAVIQITGVSNLVPIEFADSESVQVGQSVVAIGSPGGLDFMNSISQGIVSGLNRNLATDSGTSFNLIQTDAAINPGNSGGALIDKTGKLIGINVIKIASEEYEGMGFAIPSNTVKSIADELISKGTVIRATIGIYISNDYTKDFADRYGLPYGVEVSQIIVGGAAESTDLQVNDVIVKFNGNDVNDYDALKEQLSQYKPGDQVTLTVYRPSTKENIDIQLVLGEG